MDGQISFGHWLEKRRKALDLTREELAQKVGCSISTLRKIESDERRPSKQLAENLMLGNKPFYIIAESFKTSNDIVLEDGFEFISDFGFRV